MQKLFTYGLLQVPRIQQQLFKRNVEQEIGNVFGYVLSDKLVNGLYKTIKKSEPEFFTEGTILHLEDHEMEITDRFEGVSAGLYKRIQVGDGIQAYIVGADFA